jgi:hypothetical protein
MEVSHTEQRIRDYNNLNLKLLVRRIYFFLKHLVISFMKINSSKTLVVEYLNIADITINSKWLKCQTKYNVSYVLFV